MFLFVLPILPLLLFILLFHNVVSIYFFIYFLMFYFLTRFSVLLCLFISTSFVHFCSFSFYLFSLLCRSSHCLSLSLLFIFLIFYCWLRNSRTHFFFLNWKATRFPCWVWRSYCGDIRDSVTNVSKLSHCPLLQNDLLTELTTTALSDNTTEYEELEPDALTTLSVVLVGEHSQWRQVNC